MSRKIDALVAEHVMGLPQAYESKYGYWKFGDEIIEKPPKFDESTGEKINIDWSWWDGSNDLEYYSTDIAAAWEVVSHLHERSFMLVGRNLSYSACFAPRMDLYEPSDTAPMAICLAALKAKGVEVEE